MGNGVRQPVTERRLGRDSRRFLRTELGRHRGPLWQLAGWTSLEALPALLSGQLVARALDRGFLAGRPEVGLGHLIVFGVVQALAALAVRQSYPAAGTIVESLRDVLVRRVIDSTLRTAAGGGHRPDQASVARMVEQVEAVRDVTAGLLLILRRVVVTIIATVVGLVTLAPALLVLVAPPLAVSLAIFAGLVVVLARRQRTVLLAGERVASAAGPVVEGLRDVVACGAERSMSRSVGAHIDRHFHAATALARAGALRVVIIALGAHVPVVLVLLAAPSLVRGGLSTGAVVGAITYLSVSLEPALRMLVQGVAGSVLRLSVALRRLMETSVAPASPRGEGSLTPRGHRIELDQVTFSYGGEPVVSELDLVVAEGAHIAIVGPSGVGKSTLATLVAGIEHPQVGTVRIGGAPVARLEPRTVRANVVLIPQEAYVFAGSLEDNIAYLCPELTRPELDRVIDLLGLAPLLDRVGGLRAELQPTALSAGERQLIALARAYVCAAPIVVLDEATCHLDPVLEARAEQAFAARPGTLVVIAHRISSATRAQRIVLLDGARTIVATHSCLLATSSLYATMVRLWNGPG